MDVEVECEETDRVVREIPVFVSKSLAGQLYLIQYPLRPAGFSSEDTNILQSRIKPNQDKIQLKLEIDTSKRYDKKKGEQLAAAAAGVKDKETPSRSSDEDEPEEVPVLEHVMESKPIPNSAKSTRYVVGVLRDGQVHLTAIKSIVQMKDTFHHLDSADKKRDSGKAGEPAEGEATKVTVKFSQARDQPMSKLKYAKSYEALRRRNEEEPWINLNYNGKDQEEFDKLISGNSESDTPFYVLSRKNYLDVILPKQHTVSTDEIGEKKDWLAQRLTMYQLKRLPLQEQIRHIMKNGNVLRYSRLVEVLKTRLNVSIDEISVLRSTQAVAVLVQGCWVVKSELLYPTDFVSDVSGISGDLMQKGRDYILSQFTRRRIVERKEMSNTTRLPIEEVTDILSKLAVVVPKKGWEFLLPFDTEFVERYQEVAQRQALMWEMKNANRLRSKSQSQDLKPPTCSPPRRRSRHVSFSSDTDSGAESENRTGGKKGSRSRTLSARSDIGYQGKQE